MLAPAIVLCLLFSASALAQTTTFTTDCHAGITISGGGLKLTHDATNTYEACRANVPKYSGLWYFEAKINAVPTAWSAGVANNGVGNSGIKSGFSLSPGANIGADVNSAGGVSAASGEVFWFNSHTSGTTCTFTNSKTVGVALNLNTDTPQIWVTCDVTGTKGFGGGPLWNNSATASPTQAGSGHPNNGTGHINSGPFLPSYAYYPTFVGNANDSAVFNFGASSFVGTVPSGYSSWNTAGGGAPTPGPTNPLTINIANAPGYQTSHSYSMGSRVVAGPGWTPGSPGSYTSGSALYLWALSGAGGTSSGSQPAGLNNCATPASVGGGFNGTPPSGWTGATSVSDNGLTWVCLTSVDYVTLTGAFNDSSANWTTGTAYYWGEYVINAGEIYKACGNASGSGNCNLFSWTSSPPFTINAGASAPTCTTITGTCYDGAINWTPQGAITYSSQAHQWPHQKYFGGTAGLLEIQYNYIVNLIVWYGGVAQPKYLAGSNGEAIPILFDGHGNLLADANPACMNAGSTGIDLVSLNPSCAGALNWYPWSLGPASGDGWQNNVSPASTPLALNDAYGVFVENDTNYGSPVNGSLGEPIGFSDNAGTVEGLQLYSPNGVGIAGHNIGVGALRLNNIVLTGNLIDSGAPAPGALTVDAANIINNNLIIVRSASSGCWAINSGYPSSAYNNTVIGPGTTDCTFYQIQASGAGFFEHGLAYFPPPVYNNAIFGFPNTFAYANTYGAIPPLGNGENATDASSGSSGTFSAAAGLGTYTRADLGGTTFGLAEANQFVNPSLSSGTDFRIKNASASIYGTGGAFSFTTGGSTFGALAPSSDIYGTSRPVSSRYDVGAEMFVPSSAPPLTGGGQRFFH